MKKTICFLVGLTFICCSQLIAQQYTAVVYWKMEQDPVYSRLKQRQNAGEFLSSEEQSFLAEYKTKLDDYFEKLSDNEKSLYYKNRAIWSEQPGAVNKIGAQQNTEVFLGERSTYTKYVFTSGLYGFFYGLATVAIFDLNSGAAVGIPFLTAGVSTLIPILNIKDRKVTYNSLELSRHGKLMGLFHGAALSLFISGENINVNGEKLLLGLSTLSSIGLGRLGYALGRNKPWSQGRVALYSHYGILMPLEGLALDFALKIENPRVYAATFLAFGAGGYFIADRVAQWNDFTVGDITSTKTLASLNAFLGFGIASDIVQDLGDSPSPLLIPAAGALAGTIAGHFLLKDARFTSQQGRNTALAASGGAVIGLGLAAIIGLDSGTPYYLIPYITGMSTYAIMINKYKKNNHLAFLEQEKSNRWELNLMPQNIFLNRQLVNITNPHPGKLPVFLPVFTASLHF
jgi:hypothetical protein